tara:strand:+ start:2958 stop:3677 length:720 start_codon:yes stop_codon:yes gene_type:complete
MKKSQLLIDQGNSFIKFGISTDDGFVYVSKVKTIEELFEKKMEKPEIVWISSVSEKKQFFKLKDSIDMHWGSAINNVTISQYKKYLPTQYNEEQLGIDRWLAMLACKKKFMKNDCMVIDAGTAITIDLLNKDGSHVGGFILPGLHLSKKAILDGTAIKVSQNEKELKIDLGLNTIDAIGNGSLMAVISLIEKISNRYGKNLSIALGGGDCDILSESLSIPNTIIRDIVLEGLHCLASDT